MGLTSSQEQQLTQLYAEMFGILFAYASSALGDTSIAEEVVQETFCIACTKPEALFSSRNPKGWLMQTLKYVIMNTRRRLARLNRIILATVSVENTEAPAANEDSHLVLDYEDLVSKADFDLLYKHVIYHASILELSQELGISMEACKKRIQRAKKKFEKELKNQSNNVPI